MLSACKAIVVAHTPAQEQFLGSLARRCEFGSVEGFGSSRGGSENSLLPFILVHHLVGDELLSRILKVIRGGGDSVRFSPVIAVADDCPFERILSYVELGLDDVISLPEKQPVLVQRLATQLDTEHMYVETAEYFGPDRRRMDVDVADRVPLGTLATTSSGTRPVER